jgi:hypothetical protein
MRITSCGRYIGCTTGLISGVLHGLRQSGVRAAFMGRPSPVTLLEINIVCCMFGIPSVNFCHSDISLFWGR